MRARRVTGEHLMTRAPPELGMQTTCARGSTYWEALGVLEGTIYRFYRVAGDRFH
jgi:hypothetical protein